MSTSLIDSLHAVRRKVRTLTIVSGIGIALATAVGLLLAIVLIDWALGLDKLPRLIVMAAAAGTLLYVLWHWLIRPAMVAVHLGDVAGRVEHTFPQFDDRLRSTVNFMQQEIPGSAAMQDLVVKQANQMAGEINLHRVILRRPVYYSVLGAFVSIAVLALLLTWGGRTGWLKIAANRLMLGNHPWPKSVEIALDGSVPDRVAVGQRVPVKIHLTKGDKESRKAIIYYRYDNGAWQSELMTRKDGAYTAMLDAKLDQGRKNAKLDIRVESGDNELPIAPIAVVPRLEIAHVDADITPPPYVKPEVISTANLTEHPAIMAVGSKVGMRINFNKDLKSDKAVVLRPVKEGVKPPTITWDRSKPSVAIAHFEAAGSFRFTVKATDTDGFQNAGGEEYELMVREDTPPTVQIEEPKRSEDRTPVAAFDLKAVAEDDYGILGTQLVVDRISGGEKSADPAKKDNAAGPNHWVADLVKDGQVFNEFTAWEPADSSPERKRYHLTYRWDLSKLPNANLKPGDVLEYYVQVKDNYNLNNKDHPWVASGKLRITIVSLEQFMNAMQLKAEQVQGQIVAEQRAQKRQQVESTTVKEGIERNKKFDEPDLTQVSRLANDQTNTQSQTMQLADRLQQMAKEMAENKAPEAGLKKTVEQVKNELEHAAQGAMREAKKNLDDAKNAPPTNPAGKNNPQDPKAKSSAQDPTKSGPQDPKAGPQDPKAGPQDPKASSQDPKNKPGAQDPKNKAAQEAKAKSPAEQKAQAEKEAKDAQQRSTELAKAAANQEQAADELDKASRKLGEMGGLQDALAQMEKAREEQKKLAKEFADKNKQNLGKKENELSKEDKEANKKLADKQNEQSKELAQSLEKMEKKADKMKSDPAAAQAMKEAAQMGKQQGLPSKQQEAAKDMQQNQQAQAQAKQKQVETGIEQIIDKLREAQRKQLQELAKQLAQIQQLLEELIQRQAGHNIDNLVLQKTFDKVETQAKEELLELAGRDPKNLPPETQLAQLTPSQEQTYRNAVGVAKQAESLPDPAPATKITQAAGQMERAIVHLRSGKLPDAYKPPQVDALAALLEAKKEVDKAAAKAKADLDEQDSETIKQMYIKLLEEQKKIGAEVLRIDKATKDNNGEVPRADAVNLGKLTEQQGKRIADAEKIGKSLKQLESIVYDWANKDIIKAMGKVKDNLAKPDTGKPTQVAEAQTEKQLQDMIDSLIQRIRNSPFDQRNNGGGGGQGQPKPKLPSEAELRLLKKNQEGINDETTNAHQQKEKDKEALTTLGGRQNDLRGLLDTLIQKATNGQQKLGPPPDPKDELPETASKDELDNKELDQELLEQKVTEKTVDKGIVLTGNRMAQSGYRLRRIDPGPVTQEIQKRIVLDIDNLIKMAQQQQSSSKPKPGKGQPKGQPQPKPEQGQQQVAKGEKPQQGGTQAAKDSALSQGSLNIDPSAAVKQARDEWGSLTGRDRAAVQEGARDEVVKKYHKLVEDYYKSLAEQASKR